MKKKILIFGYTGNLGSNFTHFLEKKYNFYLFSNKTKKFIKNAKYINLKLYQSLSDHEILDSEIKKINPDIILNCAAITNLNFCEKFPKKTFFVNTLLPSILAEISKKYKIKFLHISTDHLYKNNVKFKKESYKRSKINKYSYQKILAENKILSKNNKSIIIRTNFFSHSDNEELFQYKIIDAIKNSKSIELFSDYYFTPIYSKYLVQYIEKLIESNKSGVFNIVSNERISKLDFAKKFFNVLNSDFKNYKIKSIKKANFAAKRCQDLSLDNKKICEEIKITIPPIDSQIREFIENDKKIRKKINIVFPYGKHSINKKDIKNVVNVLNSGSLTQGASIHHLEQKIANYLNVKYAVMVSSATAGLHLSYKAIGIDQKKQILTSPNTFVSTANAALYCNSRPIFSDICSKSLSMCPDKIEEVLKKNKNIKAIVPVHFAGLALNMNKLNRMCKEKGIKIIEDAAHAFGGTYECGTKIGSCKYSDICVFSFHPVKILAGGEGGVVTTNDEKIYKNILAFRSHGIIGGNAKYKNQSVAYTNSKRNLWYYEMFELGYHYRQTDIHCSLISSQLDRINSFLKKRKEICERYDKYFLDNPILKTTQSKFRKISSNHLYVIRKQFSKKKTKNEFMQNLRDKNIITQVHYIPVPMQLYYKNLGYNMKNLPNTKRYYDECLSIPLYYDLKKQEQDYIINCLKDLI